MRHGWALWSHHHCGYLVREGVYSAKCQDARPVSGAVALQMVSEFPGDIEAIRVLVDVGANH